jgi:hypothetical protein
VSLFSPRQEKARLTLKAASSTRRPGKRRKPILKVGSAEVADDSPALSHEQLRRKRNFSIIGGFLELEPRRAVGRLADADGDVAFSNPPSFVPNSNADSGSVRFGRFVTETHTQGNAQNPR